MMLVLFKITGRVPSTQATFSVVLSVRSFVGAVSGGDRK